MNKYHWFYIFPLVSTRHFARLSSGGDLHRQFQPLSIAYNILHCTMCIWSISIATKPIEKKCTSATSDSLRAPPEPDAKSLPLLHPPVWRGNIEEWWYVSIKYHWNKEIHTLERTVSFITSGHCNINFQKKKKKKEAN